MTADSAERSNVWRPLGIIVAISMVGSMLSARVATAGDVRPLQERGRALLAKGMARSPTFERLVHRIRRSNIVVHVDLHPLEQRKLDGALAFVGSAGGTRYLRIWLRWQRLDEDVLVAFGHELQHVAEVAGAPDVVCEASFAALWRRTGEARQRGQFDTERAELAAMRIRQELRGGRASRTARAPAVMADAAARRE